jgi:hypothetical protein
MPTAFHDQYRLDQLEALDRAEEPHSYDGEIDRLREYDEAQDAMASEMQRQGGPAYWELPEDDRQWLMDQVDRWRGGQKSYREAVALFLERRKDGTHIDELMGLFEGILEGKK